MWLCFRCWIKVHNMWCFIISNKTTLGNIYQEILTSRSSSGANRQAMVLSKQMLCWLPENQWKYVIFWQVDLYQIMRRGGTLHNSIRSHFFLWRNRYSGCKIQEAFETYRRQTSSFLVQAAWWRVHNSVFTETKDCFWPLWRQQIAPRCNTRTYAFVTVQFLILMQYVLDFLSWRTRKLRWRNEFHPLLQSKYEPIFSAQSVPPHTFRHLQVLHPSKISLLSIN